MVDSWKLSSDKRIYIGSYAIYELFYSHVGLCRDKEMLADQSVRGRFLFLLRKWDDRGTPIADSRPFTGNTPYHMKIRKKKHKVNKNKIRLKNIGQNKQFMIVS